MPTASVRESEQTRGVVADASQVSEVRRSAAALATRLGFDETACGSVALVATELATNLVKHARGGEILLRPVHAPGGGWRVEALCLDRGPGIADVARALRDGFSTAGSPGGGLGAVRRIAAEFDLYSVPGRGCSLVARIDPARIDPARHAAAASSARVAAVRVPAQHEPVSGDDWARAENAGRHVFVVADGLGHGEHAAVAARAAVAVLARHPAMQPGELLEAMHADLRSTRGAAVMVAQVDAGAGLLRHAGVGNISGVLFDGVRARHLVSSNGIVGHEPRRVRQLELPCARDWLLVMHSDGIGTRWNLDDYPGLRARDPSLIAGVLYRDHARGRDDATVLVARGSPS